MFKKRPTLSLAESLKALADSACVEVKAKWIYFDQTMHLKPGVPLATKMDMFSQPLVQFFQAKYPELLAGGSELFWLTLFTAVLESGTHPKDEVNGAIEQLRKTYGGNT